MSKKPNQWETDATFGSDIFGNGSAWGDMRGKVQTRQIGFIRSDKKKTCKNESRRNHVIPAKPGKK